MDKPSECIWCGADQIISPRPGEIYFGCWTSYSVASGEWDQDAGCVDRMAAQDKILRDRIRQALEKLKAGTRWSLAVGENEATFSPDRAGCWADASTADEVIRILEGVSDGT